MHFRHPQARGFAPRWLVLERAWSARLATDTRLADYLGAHVWIAGDGGAWGDRSVPGMRRLMRARQRLQPHRPPDAAFVLGYAQSWAVDQILERAARAGRPTRKSIRAAANSVGTLRFDGLLPDYHYGRRASDRRPPRTTTIFRVAPHAVGGLAVVAADTTNSLAQRFVIR